MMLGHMKNNVSRWIEWSKSMNERLSLLWKTTELKGMATYEVRQG
jgi:hypothetical protein